MSGDGDKDKDGVGKQLEGLKTTLKTLGEVITGMSTAMKEFDDRFDAIDGRFETFERKPDKKETSGDGNVDLETLDRKEYMNHIMTQFTGLLDQKLKPLGESINTVRTTTETKELAAELTKAKENITDFEEWAKETAQIYRASGTVTIPEAYEIARRRNPDKAKEMDEKYKMGEFDEKKKSEEKEKNPDDVFGGLLPTSGVTVPSEGMSKEAAGEAAWNKVFGGGE